MVAALGLARAPLLVRAAARAGLCLVSAPLGRLLARFEARIPYGGIAEAAAATLAELGTTWTSSAPVPASGALLVVSNHPGAYDALLLLAAIGRRDIAIIASDRPFLRALPELARHLIFVPAPPAVSRRFVGARQALRHLRRGGALLHFGAGRIEPDPAFASRAGPAPLGPWTAGVGALVRGTAMAGGVVTVAIAEAVHSARAKRLFVNRLAERRGVTTLAPLFQVALPAYRDVRARVLLSCAVDASVLALAGTDADISATVRSLALDLLSWPPPRA